MKRIIKSLAVIVAVAAIAGGATWSYFSATAIVDNNTLAAGELDITLNGDMTETVSVELAGLVPGEWSDPYRMKVYNKNGSMPVKYRFYDEFESQTVSGFYDKLNVKVEHGSCVDSFPTDISPVHKTETSKLKNMNWQSPTDSIVSPLGTNITHCFALYFQLDGSAGNQYQGASATFDVVVDATQPSNPGW